MKYYSAAALCLFGLIVLTAWVLGGIPFPGDWALVQGAVAARNPVSTALIQGITFLSSSVPALLVTLAISGVELWRTRRLRLGVGWATAIYLGNVACNIVLRIAVGRLRPEVDYISHWLPEVQAGFQRFCFPSGHAGAALIAYGALAVLLGAERRPWIGGLAAAFILVVGLGRIYLGVHWPSDVLGGYLLGGVWLGIGLALRRHPEWGIAESKDYQSNGESGHAFFGEKRRIRGQ